MICKIADLFVEVPEAGGMAPRCREYLTQENVHPDIIIREDMYRAEAFPGLPAELVPYLCSGTAFYSQLIKFGGMLLHASAVELDGEAYLFSGPSGMGKSTHTELWKQLFPRAVVFNDDKPALREIDGVWYAYGTPWSGKNEINVNVKVPLKGICFLRKGDHNTIRRLSTLEAVSAIMSQTIIRFQSPERLDTVLKLLERLAADIPVFELINRPEPEAALLSHKIMSAKDEIHED